MRNLVLFTILIFYVVACSSSSSEHDGQECQIEHHLVRLDVFHELLERANISGNTLPISAVQNFIDNVFNNLKCEEDSHEEDSSVNHEKNGCSYAMCINATQVLRLVGVDASAVSRQGGVTEDQFGNATLVLLYHVAQLDTYCHGGHLNTSLSLDVLEDFLLKRLNVATKDSSNEHPAIYASGMEDFLESLEEHLSHEHHDHGDSDHDDDDDDHHKDGLDDDDDDDDHHKGEDDDHDGDDGHNHRRRRRDANDDSGHDDDDDDDDHDDHDDDDHSSLKLVVKQKCLSSDAIFFYLGEDKNDFIESDQLHAIASVVLHLLAEGSDIEKKCRLLPGKRKFLENIFEQFSEGKKTMDIHGLESMLTKLKINPDSHESEEEEEDHSGHNHRRRRSVDEDIMTSHLHRHRRQAGTSPALTQCYSASQLMALYGGSNSLDQATFQQLCPALVSQSMYGDCDHQDMHEEHTEDYEKYGYGTLSTAIICLCAIFGVLFIPCASLSVYNTVMSLFMGLSVGTLFADATLHLIPLALGLHVHTHDHGSDIKVEEHVKVGLAIIGGLYLFYLLELFMSKCGGHSHDHDDDPNVFSNAAFEDSEKVMKDTENGEHRGMNGNATRASPKSKTGLQPVAVMIIFGDALHNFADGLAIGAGFSNSTSTGIATSIAVFCHELPHELGDFAVLIKSGLSYKKAVGLNLLSALTAFIGLYVGISISDNDEVKKWIFAIAAGMFYYIALVDVLPLLIKAKGGWNTLLNNVGMLVGFLIMFIIAIFEEHIKV